MVTEKVLAALAWVGRTLAGIVPDFAAPAWLTTTLPDAIATAGTYIDGVNVWVPFDHVPIALGFVVVALLAALGIKAARIALSFVTLGGGSAA